LPVANPRDGCHGMKSEKRAENEAVFRAANERLKDRLKDVFDGMRVPFICECSDARCLATVELPVGAYERIRAEGERRFFVLPGHDWLGERVVRRENGHVVVEKLPSG
jgi:hypothetical protein